MTREIANWISGEHRVGGGGWADKFDPHDGTLQTRFALSIAADVDEAVAAAKAAYPVWAATPAVQRGNVLRHFADMLRAHATELRDLVAGETGKSLRDATGEVGGGIAQADYFAGEGMRLHGRSLPSGVANKHSHTVRMPHGVAGLIVPANTPFANIAWKLFPALICGNGVVLKASEDAPALALRVAELAAKADLPAGLLNVIQGRGDPAGQALVEHRDVALISFTGSTPVGRWIAEAAGRRLARVSLELGGKNPFIVCDDADLDAAIHWAAMSAFSNAGQRCAAGSRIFVMSAVFDAFVEGLVERADALKLGVGDDCDLGPVITRRSQQSILAAITRAEEQGGRVLCGGGAPTDPALATGYYVQPTVIIDLPFDSDLCRHEIFGPVVTVQRIESLEQALELANGGDYGLTAAIHTRNVDRALWFAYRVRAGLANVNFGTYGSEPHMPFGGFGQSGNGTREPGAEAIDVYSELKNVSFLMREHLV